MDAKETIKKYILPKPWIKVMAIILIAIAVASLIGGIVTMNQADKAAMEDVEEFYPTESETGTMAYIDVVGVSEWLYNYDGTIYYTAEDAEGYFYTVRIGDSTYKKMKDQQEYWLRESDDEPMPDV